MKLERSMFLACSAWLLLACGAKPQATGADGGTSAPVCTALTGELAVTNEGLYGYPPYAVEGCAVAYVSLSSGDLVLRDLRTATETTLAPSSDRPRRPTLAKDTMAWEVGDAAASAVRVQYKGTTRTLTGAFDHAGEPRAAAGAVVFTAWKTASDLGDTDVLLFHADSGQLEVVADGPAQQRFADISDTHVAVTDFAESGPAGAFHDNNDDLADVNLYDRRTRTLSRRPFPGKEAFPMLASSTAVSYLHWDWAEVHPEPKLAAYWLRTGTIGTAATSDSVVSHVENYSRPFVRPAARGGILEWISTYGGAPAMWRTPTDGTGAATQVPGLDGLVLYAPSPGSSLTILATRTAGGPAILRGISH